MGSQSITWKFPLFSKCFLRLHNCKKIWASNTNDRSQILNGKVPQTYGVLVARGTITDPYTHDDSTSTLLPLESRFVAVVSCGKCRLQKKSTKDTKSIH